MAGNLAGALTSCSDRSRWRSFRSSPSGTNCARLRQARPGGGITILAEATTAVAAYLTGDRDHGPAATATVGKLVTTVPAGG